MGGDLPRASLKLGCKQLGPYSILGTDLEEDGDKNCTEFSSCGEPQTEWFNCTLLSMLETLTTEKKQHWSR